jgi:lysophospholipase L1-like esterase
VWHTFQLKMRSTRNLFVVASMMGAAFAAIAPTSFVLIGDSTTNNDTIVDSGGWGNGLCGSTITGNIASVAAGTPCINTAHDGTTAASFIASGLFNTSLSVIEGQVAEGRRTLVTIQFGTNDMKVSTPAFMGANLTTMVDQIRAIGGEPVLVSPITRRNFNPNGTIDDLLGPWAAETVALSATLQTHLLDLHAASITYCEKIGPAAANRLNRTPTDTTHLNVNGTTVFGRMVADLLVASYGVGDLPIVANPTLSYDIANGIPSF